MNNINAILEQRKAEGNKVKIQLLARKLYPEKTLASATQSLHNLRSGKTKRVTIDQINILCEELETTFEELFNQKKL